MNRFTLHPYSMAFINNRSDGRGLLKQIACAPPPVATSGRSRTHVYTPPIFEAKATKPSTTIINNSSQLIACFSTPLQCAVIPLWYRCHLKVSPRLTPFYIWFAGVTLFLMASVAAVFFPFTLPVPWAGILLVIVVLSASALPLLYGRVYIRGKVFEHSRESSTSSSFCVEPDPRIAGDATDSVSADSPLEEDLFGGELFPLLGSTDALGAGRNADIESCSLTWEECLRVRGAAKVVLRPVALTAAFRLF